MGLATQASFIGLAYFGLAFARRNIFRNLSRGNMCKDDWLWLGLATFGGYQVGDYIGVKMFGDFQGLYNHWIAYHHVKTQNRLEGRNVLLKAPRF